MKKIKRALISVSDKNSLKKLIQTLNKFKIKLISSGGTYREIKKLGKALDGIPQHIVIQEVISYLAAELKAEGGQNKSIRKIFLNQLDNLRVKEEFSWQAHGLECFNKFIEVKAKGRHDDEASGTYAFLPFQYEIDEEDEELENDIQEAVNLLGKTNI